MSDNQGKLPPDCDDLVDVLYEYVDGGCDESLRERLAEHVADCPSCIEQLGIEQQVRELLRARCCDSAPTDLRGRIVTALHTTRVRRSVEVHTDEAGNPVGSVRSVSSVTKYTWVSESGGAPGEG